MNRNRLSWLIAAAIAGFVLYVLFNGISVNHKLELPKPADRPRLPIPRPFQPDPCPDGRCPRRPGLLIEEAAPPPVDLPGVINSTPIIRTSFRPDPTSLFGFDVGGPSRNGKEIEVDLPTEFHRRNTASRGLGNCVFTSIHHSAIWQETPAVMEFPKWLIDKGIPGGGYPSKVADLIPKIAADRHLPTPAYVQHTGGDEEFLRLALRTGRCPAVTYCGRDGVYYSGNVAHMVNIVYLDDADAVILDNNYPGKYLWMTRSQFLERWRAMGGGWAVVLLDPPPPPVPTNGKPSQFIRVQCPNGGCGRVPTVQPIPLALNPDAESWGLSVTEPGVQYYSRGSLVVGKLYPDGSYKSWNGSAWTDAAPPSGAPAAIAKPEPVSSVLADNYGVDVEKITPGPYYERDGRQCDRQEAFAAIEADITDDSQTPRLTIVSTDKAARERMAAELRKLPESSKLIVRDYDPAHWHVRDVGFDSGVYLQAPPVGEDRGRVIWRFRTIPASVETVQIALRKADPTYNPANDPDPEKPTLLPSLPSLADIPAWVWFLAGIAVLYWLRGGQPVATPAAYSPSPPQPTPARLF